LLAQRGEDVTKVISMFGGRKLLNTATATILP
jgi:hypothetical protein